MRAGLRALVAGDPDLVVSAAVASLAALTGVEEQPAVIIVTPDVLDFASDTLPAAANSPVGSLPDSAVLLVTDDPDEARWLRGCNLPAWGAISPEASAEALQAAVRALAEGLVVLSPELAQGLAVQAPLVDQVPLASEAEDGITPDHLTGRESDVLALLAQGLTNKQIALKLGISEHTVKFHVSSIYSKLGVSNRTEAVRKGARHGLVPL
jgi:DNA-binding NarL/FixJ family response regulator